MAKTCGSCGRFISVAEAARCQKCSALYHRRCVAMSSTGAIAPTWHCPDCRKDRIVDNEVAGAAATSEEQRISSGRIRTNTQTLEPVVLPSTPHLDRMETPETAQELTIDITSELRIFRDNLRLINKDLQVFRAEIADLKTSLEACKHSLTELDTRVSALEKRQSVGQGSICDEFAQLKQELNERDQELLSNDIEIANLPETSGENPIHIILQIGLKLGVKLQESDILTAERKGPRHIVSTDAGGPERKPRPIAVRLTRRDLRDELLSGARARRGVTSADLGINGAPRRFYINERLTKANRQLFRTAREVGLRHGWRFVWCKRGRIFMRNKPGDKMHWVRSEADFDAIFSCTT